MNEWPATLAVFLVTLLFISGAITFYYLIFLLLRAVYYNHKIIFKINLIFWAVVLTSILLIGLSS